MARVASCYSEEATRNIIPAGCGRIHAADALRLHEELGITAPLTFGLHSRYRAELGGGMQENEFVYVYFGPLVSRANPDPAEIAEVEFASADEIKRRIARQPEAFTYWLRHYMKHHFADIVRLAKRASRNASVTAGGTRRKPAAIDARR